MWAGGGGRGGPTVAELGLPKWSVFELFVEFLLCLDDFEDLKKGSIITKTKILSASDVRIVALNAFDVAKEHKNRVKLRFLWPRTRTKIFNTNHSNVRIRTRIKTVLLETKKRKPVLVWRGKRSFFERSLLFNNPVHEVSVQVLHVEIGNNWKFIGWLKTKKFQSVINKEVNRIYFTFFLGFFSVKREVWLKFNESISSSCSLILLQILKTISCLTGCIKSFIQLPITEI